MQILEEGAAKCRRLPKDASATEHGFRRHRSRDLQLTSTSRKIDGMGKRATKPDRPAPRARETAVRPLLRRRSVAWFSVIGLAVCGIALAVWASGLNAAPQVYDYQLINAFPHDPDAYCQGLAYDDGQLYEGTGKYGKSTLRKVELQTGRVQEQVRLNSRLFGEGITVWSDKIIQLTWKENTGLVYDKNALTQTDQFRYAGEGWGITHDGRHLIVSDGTSTLRFLDPTTYRVVRRLTVRSQGKRVQNLNELEFVHGEILANVWYKDYLVRISPDNGEVTGYIDLRRLWPQNRRPDREAVLNGIAYDAETGRLFVTGKNWPKLYEIRLVLRQ